MWMINYQKEREVKPMQRIKENDLKSRRYDADRILLHVRDVILNKQYSQDQLPELVEAYTNLLDVRLDME